MKDWELIADNLSKAGWSWVVSAVDSEGGTIWVADAHRSDGKRFIVQADEILTAISELESAIRGIRRFVVRLDSNFSLDDKTPVLSDCATI